MKYINILLKKIKNLLPYILLIAIYFFFVNLEARKDRNYNVDSENKLSVKKSKVNDKQSPISIPVIPYE